MFGRHLRAGQLAYRDAHKILGLARDWLDSLPDDRPFFLMLNLMDAHEPVLPPPPFDRAFGDEIPWNPLRQTLSERSLQYDRALAYLDAEITRFLGWLEETGRFEDTVVIVTSDHGEAFGEHSGFVDHAWLLYEELLHVPLLVKPAGPREKAVEPEPFSLAELYHLSLRLTGIADEEFPRSQPEAEWYRGLSNEEIDRWAQRAGHDTESDLLTWIDGSVKFIVSSKGRVEAYDLDRDPGELRRLELPADRTEAALDFARSWWQAHPPLTSEPIPALDESALERRRALGYLGE
jgi:arylsulfatase A-like enzyme